MEETKEISLQEIFEILWQKAWVIVGAALVGGIVSFCISRYVIEPTYTSRVSMYVNNNADRQNTVANINDINASQKLVGTYIEILQSNTVLEGVVGRTGLPYTAADIRKMMTANSMNSTEIFEVKITTESSEEAALLANTIAELAPEAITRVVKAGAVELIDKAVPATVPTSPHIAMNTLIGMMLGGVLSVLAVFVIAMLDNRIKSEEDLKNTYELPVLGSIPDLEEGHTRVK